MCTTKGNFAKRWDLSERIAPRNLAEQRSALRHLALRFRVRWSHRVAPNKLAPAAEVYTLGGIKHL
jgi:hypothetical protein